MTKLHPVHVLQANLEAARLKLIETLAAREGIPIQMHYGNLRQSTRPCLLFGKKSRRIAQGWDGAIVANWTK